MPLSVLEYRAQIPSVLPSPSTLGVYTSGYTAVFLGFLYERYFVYHHRKVKVGRFHSFILRVVVPLSILFNIKDYVEPFIDHQRWCNIHQKTKLNEEIDRLLEEDVLWKMEEHTDWYLPICIDPQKLNASLKR